MVTCKNLRDGLCMRSVNTHVATSDQELLKDPIECPCNGDVQECLDDLIDVSLEIDGITGDYGLWSCYVLGCIIQEDHRRAIEKEKATC